MPLYDPEVSPRSPFHEINDLLPQLLRAAGDCAEEERVKAALQDAARRFRESYGRAKRVRSSLPDRAGY